MLFWWKNRVYLSPFTRNKKKKKIQKFKGKEGRTKKNKKMKGEKQQRKKTWKVIEAFNDIFCLFLFLLVLQTKFDSILCKTFYFFNFNLFMLFMNPSFSFSFCFFCVLFFLFFITKRCSILPRQVQLLSIFVSNQNFFWFPDNFHGPQKKVENLFDQLIWSISLFLSSSLHQNLTPPFFVFVFFVLFFHVFFFLSKAFWNKKNVHWSNALQTVFFCLLVFFLFL